RTQSRAHRFRKLPGITNAYQHTHVRHCRYRLTCRTVGRCHLGKRHPGVLRLPEKQRKKVGHSCISSRGRSAADFFRMPNSRNRNPMSSRNVLLLLVNRRSSNRTVRDCCEKLKPAKKVSVLYPAPTLTDAKTSKRMSCNARPSSSR